MPKGDRNILKADLEDGHTPIANLLLEAVAIAKLTGKEKGIILFLMRKTYGWQHNNTRLKETTFAIRDCAKVCSTDTRTAQKLLARLAEKKVLLREFAKPGFGYTYQINTRVGEWNHSCLNHQLLVEIPTVGLVKSQQ